MKLKEDDVPGAKLKFAKIEDHLVRGLKLWLACRSLPVSGNKNVLVERIAVALYDICLCIVNGHDKMKRMKLLNPVPDTFPSNWAIFPSRTIPRTFGYAMYNYDTSGPIDNTLNLNETLFDDEESQPNRGGNSKALQRGRQYCLSGFVLNIDNAIDKSYYLIAGIKSSFRATVTYKISVALTNNSSKIINAVSVSGCFKELSPYQCCKESNLNNYSCQLEPTRVYFYLACKLSEVEFTNAQ